MIRALVVIGLVSSLAVSAFGGYVALDAMRAAPPEAPPAVAAAGAVGALATWRVHPRRPHRSAAPHGSAALSVAYVKNGDQVGTVSR